MDDLDDQLSTQFTNAKKYIGDENIFSVEDRKDLRENKKVESGGYFLLQFRNSLKIPSFSQIEVM